MAIWLGPMGKPAAKRPPKFTATGTLGVDYLYTDSTDANGIVHFEIAVLNPCAFTFSRIVPVDLALIGAGQAGSAGYDDTESYPDSYGGTGGDGGNILRVQNVTLSKGTQILFSPGIDGADTTVTENGSTLYSSANTQQARKSGGEGARAAGNGYGTSHDAGNGADGEFPWDAGSTASALLPGVLFGPGGGGGGATNSLSYSRSKGFGGNTGGGDGGDNSSISGTAGAANRGTGGGGGRGYIGFGNSGSAGGSGIAFIRDHR